MSEARSGVREVEGARLEIVYAATYRGFESHPLRHQTFRARQMRGSCEEQVRRDEVIKALIADIMAGRAVRLPEFDRANATRHTEPALLRMGEEANPYGGTCDGYRYQFEGEDDLLHLMVTRSDLEPLSVEEAQAVVAFVIPQVPPGLLWLKPGVRSQHFHFGHDLLIPG